MKRKKNIIFVGSFADKLDDDRIGGQMIACNALIKSTLSDDIEWVLLDTTAVLPLQHVLIRGLKALRRIVLLLWLLIRYDIDRCLIFCGSGYSFMEKGIMVRISNLFGVPAILAPRSGLILKDLAKPRMSQYIASIFEKCDVVICQSDAWRATFSALLPDDERQRFKVIYNWVDEHIYRPSIKEKDRSEIRVLYMGWVVDYKGIYEVIHAVGQIKDECPSIRVDICGNGDDFDHAVELIQSRNLSENIQMHGWVDFNQKIQFLAESDIYLIPSHYEGFPNALLEAMSCGLPSIATDVGAISAAIKNRENGFLIKAKSAEEIAECLTVLYNDAELRNRLGHAARRTVEDKFSKRAAIEKFRKILIDNAK